MIKHWNHSAIDVALLKRDENPEIFDWKTMIFPVRSLNMEQMNVYVNITGVEKR